MDSKGVLIGIIVLLLAGGAYWFINNSKAAAPEAVQTGTETAQTPQSAQAKMSPEAGRAVGKWKSTDDAKFTREFRADGTVTDTYEGDASATANGTWSQVVDVTAEPFQFPAVGGATFLKLVLDGQTYYFSVSADTTADKLVLVHLSGRGNILSFTRVN
ncbi:hypothetical protein A2680_00530 [Candidatus Kaiserbacteria bacterium RIFCSPHIGHO2_01_FULL_55_37]|nr:MAG: hypothetical protein A2680_00530 [Candidatus Kaiserbacteria bacterium RIFCSPHIGHO2_01_FULL_55_37]